MQSGMKYGCRKTIRDKTLHVWNSACIVNNYLLRQEEKLRLRSCRTMLNLAVERPSGSETRGRRTSLKHGFGDAEQEQLGCSLVRHLRSRISGGGYRRLRLLSLTSPAVRLSVAALQPLHLPATVFSG